MHTPRSRQQAAEPTARWGLLFISFDFVFLVLALVSSLLGPLPPQQVLSASLLYAAPARVAARVAQAQTEARARSYAWLLEGASPAHTAGVGASGRPRTH